MNVDARNYLPLKEVDNLNPRTHSMILYDNEECGKLVKYRYVENGLKKGERSVCLTHDNVNSVEKEIASTGIDVDNFKRKNLLHVYQIENLTGKEYEEMIAGFNKILRETTRGFKPPYRFMGRIIPNVCTKEGIETELKLERVFHSTFDNYDCSFLCTYAVNDIEGSKRTIWLKHLVANHHNLICATDAAGAVALDPDLLDTFGD